jgi:hypothetical protein
VPVRIETAEVLSFRLKVPVSELPRLPALLSGELSLSVENDEGETVLSAADSDSYLRFKAIGPEAMLTEVFLCNDVGGLFFEKVLAALMVRHGGDLHARLVWSVPDRNTKGDYAEVRIDKGLSSQPSLIAAGAALAADEEEEQGAAEVEGADVHSALELEVAESLARAKAHWAEYQRLKAKKG